MKALSGKNGLGGVAMARKTKQGLPDEDLREGFFTNRSCLPRPSMAAVKGAGVACFENQSRACSLMLLE